MVTTISLVQATFVAKEPDVRLCAQVPKPGKDQLFKLVYKTKWLDNLDVIKQYFKRKIQSICTDCDAPIVFVEPRVGLIGESLIVEFWCWMPPKYSEKYWQTQFSDDETLNYHYDPRYDCFYSQAPR